MTTLQGGVEYNQVGGQGGGIGGATPWGALIQEIGKHRDAARKGFGELAQGMTMNSLAASNFHPSFNPTMTPIQQAPMMQGNLYNRLMG